MRAVWATMSEQQAASSGIDLVNGDPDVSLSDTYPVVPVEFTAEMGIYLVDDGVVPERIKGFASELRDFFLVNREGGITVQDRFPGVGIEIAESVDGKTGTVTVGSVAVFFENTSITDAESLAASFAIPDSAPYRNLRYSVVTQESELARSQEREEMRRRAQEFIAERDDSLKRDREKNSESSKFEDIDDLI